MGSTNHKGDTLTPVSHSTGRKTCSACGKDLALSSFALRKTSPDGYRNQCKRCRAKVSLSTATQRRQARLAHETRACRTCSAPLKIREVSGRFNLYCDECRKLRQRCRRVGITVHEYHALYKAQQGLCLLCEVRPVEVIDHNYLTSRVRGLLCNGCNLLAGWAAQQGSLAISKLEAYLVSH